MRCKVKITAVKGMISLFPEESLSLQVGGNQFIYLEMPKGLEIHFSNSKTVLDFSTAVIAKKIIIKNINHDANVFQGIYFRHHSDYFRRYLYKRISKNRLNRNAFSELFRSYIADPTCPIKLRKLEKEFQLHLNRLTSLSDQISFSSSGLNGKIDLRLIYINRYIRKYYYRPITLQLLADIIQCNPVYLSNTYSKVFGVSPIKYLQQIRMRQAQTLLLNKIPIHEIASHLGYVSNSQFTDIFKRYHDLTPSQFRRNHLKSNT
ncbi:helix-turn-helix transcriptional regulator [Paenibacillus sp. IB182496]|uniref:Helix-turn-helix transcriptional regulator n=1 Tax=Paenibacillus sabuli TaxID=2772509 RepID=A0A927GTM1_9BACL|nr:AraC family transcriptional regulator [Paenibacillus sabuli]MBD2847471.1 helix-turn-helix transcriptional regulator [Paenibacillus sabuli]